MQSIQRKFYGPPRRPVFKPYSTKLESIENFKNKIISSEYLPSIVEHFKEIELNSSVNAAMIDLQPEVKWYMRPYLVNFIIQLHSSLKLKPQTLFICWNIIDRYCAKRIAFKQHYQLIGCTALWIASKYEDKKSRVPNIKELNSMCSNVYDDSMFKEMEIHILSTLNWSIGHTTLEDILQLAVKYSDPDGKELLNKPLELYKGNTPTVSAILAVSRYLCELSLYEREYLNHSTSLIGITCFLMSCTILNMDIGSNFINNIYENFENSMNVKNKINNNHNNNINKSSISISKDCLKNIDFFSFNNNDDNEDNDLNIGNLDDSILTDNESIYDSDSENIEPLKQNFGPFIQGFNGLDTINEIRSIALQLFKSILDPSEVLIEKYSSLGVMTVVKRFIDENDLYHIDLSLLNNSLNSNNNNDANSTLKEKLNTVQFENPYSLELTNLLLSFNELSPFIIQSNLRDLSVASSADSIFCTPCDSPSNFSSFSSVSSATSYSFSSNSDFAINNVLKEKLI
jgi:hypothetical protein